MNSLDIRWPLGCIFTLVGGILIAYGTFADSAAETARGINAEWGAVLLLFGATMLLLARRGAVKVHRDA